MYLIFLSCEFQSGLCNHYYTEVSSARSIGSHIVECKFSVTTLYCCESTMSLMKKKVCQRSVRKNNKIQKRRIQTVCRIVNFSTSIEYFTKNFLWFLKIRQFFFIYFTLTLVNYFYFVTSYVCHDKLLSRFWKQLVHQHQICWVEAPPPVFFSYVKCWRIQMSSILLVA